MDIQSALQYLVGLGRAERYLRRTGREKDEDLYLSPDGTITRVPLDPRPLNMTLLYLSDFFSYVHSRAKDRTAVVAIDPSHRIVADFEYGTRIIDTALCVLRPSDPRVALGNITSNSSSLGALWKFLNGPLSSNIDPTLKALIASLQVNTFKSKTSEIAQTGITSNASKNEVTITNADGQPITIPTDWEYNGTRWTCWDEKMTVQLRLDIHMGADDSLRFRFYGLDLEEVEKDIDSKLIAYVQKSLSNHEVYAGNINNPPEHGDEEEDDI